MTSLIRPYTRPVKIWIRNLPSRDGGSAAKTTKSGEDDEFEEWDSDNGEQDQEGDRQLRREAVAPKHAIKTLRLEDHTGRHLVEHRPVHREGTEHQEDTERHLHIEE